MKTWIATLLLVAATTFLCSAQQQATLTGSVKVGDRAPDFTLEDQNGQKVTLSKADRTTLLVFYRGYW